MAGWAWTKLGMQTRTPETGPTTTLHAHVLIPYPVEGPSALLCETTDLRSQSICGPGQPRIPIRVSSRDHDIQKARLTLHSARKASIGRRC